MTDITAKLAETLAQEPWPAKVRLGNHLFQNSYDDGSYYCYELRASIKFADRAALSALPRAEAALEGLRELSERAALTSNLEPAGEWGEFGAILCDSEGEPVLDVYHGKPTAEFIRAAVNYVRARLAAQAGDR